MEYGFKDLRDALAPFAAAAKVMPAHLSDEALLFSHFPSLFGGQTELRVGDLRRAAEVYTSATNTAEIEDAKAEAREEIAAFCDMQAPVAVGKLFGAAIRGRPIYSELPPFADRHNSEASWERYANDFDGMTDAQIKAETNQAELDLENAENWLEAVASWEAAGRPRSVPALSNSERTDG